jgi:hypothetical protein
MTFQLQAFAHHAQAVDERSELHRVYSILLPAPMRSTNFTL